MNVLIIGINGFLGRAIAAESTATGAIVFGLSRSDTPNTATQATYLVGDRCSPQDIRKLISERNIDVVVDVLAMTLSETLPLISEFEGRVAQYVMLSSSDVYRNYELLHRKAEGTPTLEKVDENAALRSTRFPYRDDSPRSADDSNHYLDDYDKIPIEQAVRKLSIDWTILRLPMIYGPGDKQRRFNWAISHMMQSDETLLIPRSWASWVATYGYVDDVALGISMTFGKDKAKNMIFNLGEPQPVGHLTWAERIAEVIRWKGDVKLSDDQSSPFAQRLRTLDLSVPLKISTERVRSELGFSESVTMSDGLLRTVEDEKSRG